MAGQYVLPFEEWLSDRARPKRPERLFYAIFFDRESEREIERCGNRLRHQFGIAEPLLRTDRFHVSLDHLGDYKRIKTALLYGASLAGSRVSVPEFEITFRYVGCFESPPKKDGPRKWPFVLQADPGPVQGLHDALGKEMAGYGLRIGTHFAPHLTLAYSTKFVAFQEIEPIKLVATQFALVHSWLWLSRYDFHGRWTLGSNSG